MMVFYIDSATETTETTRVDCFLYRIVSTETMDDLAEMIADIKDILNKSIGNGENFRLFRLWADSKIKAIFAMIHGIVRVDYPRRMLISKSGFLGRVGRKRKN